MSDYQKILTGMKRNELEAVAREFNKTYKISAIGKKKKQDLILELLNNEKLLDEVFNRLYPKGEPIKDITKKSKRKVNKQNKKMISKSEEETLRTEIKKQLKEAMEEKSPSGKLKLLKSVQKLQQKLSRVEVKEQENVAAKKKEPKEGPKKSEPKKESNITKNEILKLLDERPFKQQQEIAIKILLGLTNTQSKSKILDINKKNNKLIFTLQKKENSMIWDEDKTDKENLKPFKQNFTIPEKK